MQRKDFFEDFVYSTKKYCPGITFEYGVQTNGTLLNQEWIDIFKQLNIQIGISLDGPREASKHRIFRNNGKPAFDRIIQGANLIKENGLTLSTLSVINTEYPAKDLYKYIKELGVGYTDFLYPDITYDAIVDDKFSKWVIELFNYWYYDNKEKPIIRYFELIIKMLLGTDVGFEALGRHNNQTLCIKNEW